MLVYHLVLLVYYALISHAAPAPLSPGGPIIAEAVIGTKDASFGKLGEDGSATAKLSSDLKVDTARSTSGDSGPSALHSITEDRIKPEAPVDLGNALFDSRLGSEVKASHTATTGTRVTKERTSIAYYDEFRNEVSQITEKSLWQEAVGMFKHVFKDLGKPPIKEVPGYDSKWLEETQLQGLGADPIDLARFRDKIGGMDVGRNAFIKVDPRDPAPLQKMMSEDSDTFTSAYHYYQQLLGPEEFIRRMKVSNGQYDQLRITKGWLEESRRISAELNIPPWQAEEAGKIFGADEFFTSFERIDKRKTLAKIEEMKNNHRALYDRWKKFIGPEELERRVDLLHALDQFKDIKIPPKQLSAWQMQGLDVDRMVTAWAHSQPEEVNGRTSSRVQSLIDHGQHPQQEEEYAIFWDTTKSGQAWQESLEHEELLKFSPGAKNYREAWHMIHAANTRTAFIQKMMKDYHSTLPVVWGEKAHVLQRTKNPAKLKLPKWFRKLQS